MHGVEKVRRLVSTRSAVAFQWRNDRSCTLDGQPAVIAGWDCPFAVVSSGRASFEFAWETVARIMAKDRAFRS